LFGKHVVIYYFSSISTT